MKKNSGIELGELDFQLFDYLHSVKVATFNQIRRDIYKNHTLKSVANRMRLMENARLVNGNVNRMLRGKEKYLSLTRQAFDRFVAKKFEKRIELRSDAVNHDLSLVDIRSRFLRSSAIIDYVTENEIQTWNLFDRDERYSLFSNLNSDAIVKTQIGGVEACIPIEYDRCSKTNLLYESFLKKYYDREEVYIVLFVAETEAIQNQLMSVERNLNMKKNPKFFYTTLQQLLSSDTLSFLNCRKGILKID